MNLDNNPLHAQEEQDEDVPEGQTALVVDVVRHHDGWAEQEIKEACRAARLAVQAVYQKQNKEIANETSLALVFADNAFVQNLNKKYRALDKTTNVLAFPAGEAMLLGDVIMAHETLCAEAVEKDITPAAHAAHLAAHGTLHLLGFTHDEPRRAEQMEALEIEILQSLGIANPYQEDIIDE